MGAHRARDDGAGTRQVTVAGGTGYLGRAIVARLAAAGHRVRIAARNPPPPSMPAGASIEFLRTDIRDPEGVAAAVGGADAVINTVSLYVERGGTTFRGVHVDAAATLARAAREQGAGALVHVSGIGVDAASDSPYVRARALGEAAVRDEFPAAVILRPSALFGGADALRTALSGLARLPVIPLFGDGSVRLQPVDVDDVAAAVTAALDRPDLCGHTLELGGASVLTYRDMVRMAAQGRRRWMLPVPFALWRLLARITGLLPGAPLTFDQVVLMERDNVVSADRNGLVELGIEPRPFGMTTTPEP